MTASKKKRSKKGIILTAIGRFLIILLTVLVISFVGLYSCIKVICHGPSTAARDMFVTTVLETGALGFLASWYFDEEEILAITGNNGLEHITAEVDPNLVKVQAGSDDNTEEDFDINKVEIIEISGRAFYGKLMIINDPARVKTATIYPWSDDNKSKNGLPLDELVGDNLAGINGGMYESSGNWGGQPMGLVVCEGDIQFNVPKKGDVLVGFNEDNILMIMDIGNMSAANVEKLVKENKIRDAVSFKDIDDGDSNHFTKLIVNGESRQISGLGSGANPRTVIGQRADGAVLMLVTDGRGSGGHLGATAADLIAIMEEYGAVNAANLDGGSSSAMVYDGKYEMTSVTLYHSSSSWNLPTGFVVERRGN